MNKIFHYIYAKSYVINIEILIFLKDIHNILKILTPEINLLHHYSNINKSQDMFTCFAFFITYIIVIFI